MEISQDLLYAIVGQLYIQSAVKDRQLAQVGEQLNASRSQLAATAKKQPEQNPAPDELNGSDAE